MKVLLIDPPGDQRGWNAGLAYLSGALAKAGIDHAVLDMVNAGVSLNGLAGEISAVKPDLVGISIKTATYYPAVEIAQKIKMELPRTVIVAGGPHVTLYYEELLNEAACFDAAFIGDAEESLVEFAGKFSPDGPLPEVPGLACRSETLECNPRQVPMDLDALPMPEFDNHIHFDPAWHPYPLVTSRGCPYGCTFCSVGKVSGKRWRNRSPKSVVDELEHARSKWGFTDFDVLDDTFTQNVDRAREICRILIERDLRMRWSCPNGIRADRITQDLMEDMAEAGCHTVIFGVESADPELFASIRKGERLDDAVNAIKMSKDAGLRVGGFFIIGLPGDSFDKNIRGLEFADEIGLDWAHFNILAPYPGTEVWDEIEKKGRFLEDYRRAQHFSSQIKPIFELNDFSAKEIARTYKTVHVKQGLYHLLLPPGLGSKQQKRAIRKLRIKYDREGWKSDVKRDVKQVALKSAVLVKAGAWAINRGKSISPNDLPKRSAHGDNLKVLFVNDYIGRAGGTERYIYDLVQNLADEGHETAWAFEKDVGKDGINIPGYQIQGLAEPARAEKVERAMDHVMGEFDPDIIHIHNVHTPQIVNACVKRRPTMRTVHDHNIVCPSMNKMWRTGRICNVPAGLSCVERLLDGGCHVIGMRPGVLMERLSVCLDGIAANRHLPKIMTTTTFMHSELLQNGFDGERVETLPLFIDFPDQPARMENSEELRILWAGRIVLPDKGADFFLDTLWFMRAPYKAVLAGSGPHEDHVRKKAKELELGDKLEFRGKVSAEEMERLYRWCHVVAFTAMWAEPFGYVGIEAAARGRPVAAFDVGGVSDWLKDRKGGFLAQRGNCRALALRLDRLAYNAADRAAMGQAHFEHTRLQHDKSRHMSRLVEIYNELLS